MRIATRHGWPLSIVPAFLIGLALLYFSFPARAPVAMARGAASPWSIWQLPPQSHSQQMSYVMRNADNELVVVDGGTTEDAPYLREFIRDHGDKVAAWFLTHPHPDHVDALAAILALSDRPAIGHVYADLPSEAWVADFEPFYSDTIVALNKALGLAHVPLVSVHPGDRLSCGGIPIMILAGHNPEIHTNAINNSSLVFKIHGPHSMLFCGDLGKEGGDKLRQGPFALDLHSHYLQMPHHGQAAVNRAFFLAVSPRVCFWPTPAWLWDNDAGRGPNTGPWTTLETRVWMRELQVERNIVAKDGLAEVRDSL